MHMFEDLFLEDNREHSRSFWTQKVSTKRWEGDCYSIFLSSLEVVHIEESYIDLICAKSLHMPKIIFI